MNEIASHRCLRIVTGRSPRALASLRGLLAVVLLVGGCGDDDAGDGTSTSSAGAPTSAETRPSSSSMPLSHASDETNTTDDTTASTSADCEQMLHSTRGVRVPPLDAPTVQPALAHTGERLLAGWSGPGAGISNLAPWFGALTCADDDPFAGSARTINERSERNELAPRIAISGERVLVVWQLADGDNQVLYRQYTLDGAPLDEAPRTLESDIDGTPIAGRTWQPDAAPMPDGRFAIAAAFSDPDAGAFRAYVQLLGDDGDPLGDAHPLPAPPRPGEEETLVRHENPTIATTADGDVRVAWSQNSETKDDVLVAALSHEDDGGWTHGEIRRLLPDEHNAVTAPRLATLRDDRGHEQVWLAFSVFGASGDLVAVDVSDPDLGADVTTISENELAFHSTLAGDAAGRVLAIWQARDDAASARGEVVGTWLRFDDGVLVQDDGGPHFTMDGARTHVAYPLAHTTTPDGFAVAWNASTPDDGWSTRVRAIRTPD